MTLDLAHLRALLSAATPGPWESRTEVGHPGVRAVAARGAFDWVCSMQVSNSPRYEADAALIAALRNSIEPLLAIAEAALAWRDKSVHTGDANCAAGDCDNCTEAAYLDELRAALAKLDGGR